MRKIFVAALLFATAAQAQPPAQPPAPPQDMQGGAQHRPPPQAFADCKGKKAGDAVKHATPRGEVVPATCVQTPDGLAARPDRPPKDQMPPPPNSK